MTERDKYPEPTDAQAWAAAQAVAALRKQETGVPSWFSVDHARAALRAAAAIQEGERAMSKAVQSHADLQALPDYPGDEAITWRGKHDRIEE